MFMTGVGHLMEVRLQILIVAQGGHRNPVIRGSRVRFSEGVKMVVIRNETVVEPNVHDALVLGVLLHGDGCVLVPLEAADKRPMCLVLGGVERLKADNFREGNTLLSLTVTSSSTLDVRDVAEAYGVAPDNET